MIRHFAAAMLLSSAAVYAQVQTPENRDTWPEGVDATFAYLARKIDVRSIENCDPEVDVPALSTSRQHWLEARSVREDDRLPLMTAMATVNAGTFNVCADKRLEGSGYTAVIYAGKPRVIAVNPEFRDRIETVVVAGYESVKDVFLRYGQGQLTDADLDRPMGLRADPAIVPTADPPAQAPRKQPEFR